MRRDGGRRDRRSPRRGAHARLRQGQDQTRGPPPRLGPRLPPGRPGDAERSNQDPEGQVRAPPRVPQGSRPRPAAHRLIQLPHQRGDQEDHRRQGERKSHMRHRPELLPQVHQHPRRQAIRGGRFHRRGHHAAAVPVAGHDLRGAGHRGRGVHAG